ncbi:hypothetical protein PRIPAC_96504 [Pristionchus pacificus]|uniref:Uncharacterized protein n=1 Tax=Pristionchus pacificus TaxID=54126 RepID=A0A2A6CU94_PRIPA|nr:hypothetical protein PRIPAC_96504 [Pristionchus pacificus]|eukprot:PDM81601.1 hypothetical protein PRIPAC_30582 [Pristionchus pacificus]
MAASLPTSHAEESPEDLKVAVILTLVDVLNKVEHIIPDEKVVPIEQLVPRKKREFDASEFEEPFPFIDDMTYSEEKEMKRLLGGFSNYPSRKVTFSSPLEHCLEYMPPPPPTVMQRTLTFIRKVGRYLCITEPDDEDYYEEEEEPILDYKDYRRYGIRG